MKDRLIPGHLTSGLNQINLLTDYKVDVSTSWGQKLKNICNPKKVKKNKFEFYLLLTQSHKYFREKILQFRIKILFFLNIHLSFFFLTYHQDCKLQSSWLPPMNPEIQILLQKMWWLIFKSNLLKEIKSGLEE